jgi:hypothetical protein
LATGSELSDGKLEAIMSVQPQEQETHFKEEPNNNLNPTRGSDASAPGNLHVMLSSEATDENPLITPLQTDGNRPQADILNQENVQANLEKDGAVRLMEPAIIQEDNPRSEYLVLIVPHIVLWNGQETAHYVGQGTSESVTAS